MASLLSFEHILCTHLCTVNIHQYNNISIYESYYSVAYTYICMMLIIRNIYSLYVLYIYIRRDLALRLSDVQHHLHHPWRQMLHLDFEQWRRTSAIAVSVSIFVNCWVFSLRKILASQLGTFWAWKARCGQFFDKSVHEHPWIVPFSHLIKIGTSNILQQSNSHLFTIKPTDFWPPDVRCFTLKSGLWISTRTRQVAMEANKRRKVAPWPTLKVATEEPGASNGQVICWVVDVFEKGWFNMPWYGLIWQGRSLQMAKLYIVVFVLFEKVWCFG